MDKNSTEPTINETSKKLAELYLEIDGYDGSYYIESILDGARKIISNKLYEIEKEKRDGNR